MPYFHEAYEEIIDSFKDSIDNVSEKEVSRFGELLVEESEHRVIVLGVGIGNAQASGIKITAEETPRENRVG